MSQMNIINEDGTAFNGSHATEILGFIVFVLITIGLGWAHTLFVSIAVIGRVIADWSEDDKKELILAAGISALIYSGYNVLLQLGF